MGVLVLPLVVVVSAFPFPTMANEAMTRLFSHRSKDTLTIASVGLEWLPKSVIDNSEGVGAFS